MRAGSCRWQATEAAIGLSQQVLRAIIVGMTTLDLRLDAPATHRNREPILAVLQQFLPTAGEVVEVAAGTGQHAAFFASRLPRLRWQPTDPDARSRASIDAWRQHVDLSNLLPAIELDVMRQPWPVSRADVVICINMIHISPWAATLGLMRGAATLLPGGGLLVTYGPYNVDGRFTAPSNRRFDESLRERDPAWGIRDIAAVTAAGDDVGLERISLLPMPANNFTAVFRKR